MDRSEDNWAVIVPMANEEKDLPLFATRLTQVFDKLGQGTAYFVIDRASKDRTLEVARKIASQDARINIVWAPECRNIVEAYLRGYREAFLRGHEIIIEMDAGLSHDPAALPTFLHALHAGCDCAFGSRAIRGGSFSEASLFRKILSTGGTLLSNLLLGTKLKDMTSGYIGFKAEVVGQFLQTPFLSKAHFYQTELRYLVRDKKCVEVPIHYRAPSPSVGRNAIINSFEVLFHYFFKRITLQSHTALSSRNAPLARPAKTSVFTKRAA